MVIYEITDSAIRPLNEARFGDLGMRERQDIQRLLRDHIEVVAPGCLVIGEEFGDWEDSRRRIDLLAIDKDANLVVIEIKRTDDGGHMELQAIRYAAMVSTLTAEKAVEIYGSYLATRSMDEDPEQELLKFLEWDELSEDEFGQDVRVVLVSADFSREVTSAVMWLNEKELDIRCVRIRPYQHDGQTLMDVQQVIPLPEAADFQVRAREKKRKERGAKSSVDFTRFDLTVEGEVYPNQWKRNAMLIVVKHLARRGVAPSEITETLGVTDARLWRSVEGSIEDPDEFNSKMLIIKPNYNERRWHTRGGDLLIHAGRTYALSNQWGKRWPDAMSRLKERYPALELAWSPNAGTVHDV